MFAGGKFKSVPKKKFGYLSKQNTTFHEVLIVLLNSIKRNGSRVLYLSALYYYTMTVEIVKLPATSGMKNKSITLNKSCIFFVF